MVPSILTFIRNQNITQGFDLLLGRWHKTVSVSDDLITPIPCFIDHLGDDSLLAMGRGNGDIVGHFRGFRGYDFSYRGLDG
jgi:hypothetical protein